MSHSVIFVYEDKHVLGVCLILCLQIKVFTEQKSLLVPTAVTKLDPSRPREI